MFDSPSVTSRNNGSILDSSFAKSINQTSGASAQYNALYPASVSTIAVLGVPLIYTVFVAYPNYTRPDADTRLILPLPVELPTTRSFANAINSRSPVLLLPSLALNTGPLPIRSTVIPFM